MGKMNLDSLKQKNAALLLIDLQQGWDNEEFWGGNRNNPQAEEVCSSLLEYWRLHELPIFHVRHSSLEENSRLNPNHPGFAWLEVTKPLEHEYSTEKHVNSAFIGTDLKEQLDKKGITTLVIVGLTTNHCVSTTTRMAGNFGYETYLVEDGTATFDRKGLNGETFPAQLIHDTALASLNEEFTTVIKSADILEAV